MKNKKIIFYLLIFVFVAGLLSSCAIDRKCPAYTQASIQTNDRKA